MKNLRRLLRSVSPTPSRQHSEFGQGSEDRSRGSRSSKGRNQRTSKRRLLSESLEDRQLLAGDVGASIEPSEDVAVEVAAAHNYWNAYDVDNSGAVTPLDALKVINHLNSLNAEGEAPALNAELTGFVDVNSDHNVTALDALMVINELNAEGEAIPSDYTVGYQITPRNLDDTLLTDVGDYDSVFGLQSDIYEISEGVPFKIEIATQDNRGIFDATGVFQAVVDVLVDQTGVLVPAVGEIQGAILPPTIFDSASADGTVEFSYDGSADIYSISVDQLLTSDGTAISATAVQAEITKAIIDLNSLVVDGSEIDVSVAFSQTTGLTYEVSYNAVDFANLEIPTLRTRLTTTSGEQAVQILEENLYLTDGSFNSELLVTRYELFMRNHTTRSSENGGLGPEIYGQLTDGSFITDMNGIDKFDEIRVLGPNQFLGGTNNPAIPNFSTATYYDTLSIPVVAIKAATNVTVRAELLPERTGAASGTDDEPVLIYGADPETGDAVPGSQILFSSDAQFMLNVIGTESGLTADDTTATILEDAAETEIADLSDDGLITIIDGGTDVTIVSAVASGGRGTTRIDGDTIFYTPDADDNGTVEIVYTASNEDNGTGGSDTGTITVTITPQNDAPTIPATVAASTNENTAVSIDVAGEASDIDGDTLTASVANSTPSDGSVSIVAGNVLYTPNTGFNGTDSFTVDVTDGTETVTTTVNVTVNNVVSAPIAGDKIETAVDEAAQTITVDLSALVTADPDDTISFDIVSQATGLGVATISGTDLILTLGADDNGTGDVVYRATGTTGSDTGTISFTVNPINDAPTLGAIADQVVEENSSIDINLLTAAADVDGDTLTAVVVTQGTKGVATVNGGVVTYTPNTDELGDDSIVVRVIDGNGGESSTQTIDITITDVILAPVAGPGSLTAVEDGPDVTLELRPLVNAQAGVVSFTFTQPDKGSAVVSSTGTLTYTPDADSNGQTTLTYTATNAVGSSTGTITINITATADAPVLGAISDQTVNENSFVDIDLAAFGSDADGDALIAAVVTQGSKGTATTTGSVVRYTPGTDLLGDDSIEVQVSDGNGGVSSTQTININITDVVLAPVAGDGTLAAVEDGPNVTLDLRPLVNAQAGTVTFVITQPTDSKGTASVDSTGTLTYNPDADSNGQATLTYTATNAIGSSTGTITINITATNDAPIAVNDVTDVVKNGSVQIAVLGNDTPNPGGESDTITVSVESGDEPSDGTVTITNNVVTYTPDADFIGTDSFTYTVSDGNGGTDTATVTITVLDFETSTVSGQLFKDSDGSGSLDSNEIALGGVPVRLVSQSVNAAGLLVDLTVFTDLDGNYEFTDVPPGDYEIQYDLHEGMEIGGNGASGVIPITVVGGAAGSADAVVSENFEITNVGTFRASSRSNASTNPGTENLPEGVTADELSFFLFAYNEDTGEFTQSGFNVGADFEGVEFIELAFNSARDEALLTVVNADGSVQTAVVNSNQLQVTNNGTRAQLYGDLEDFAPFFQNPTDTSDFAAYGKAVDAYFGSTTT
ncbi:Ig-like domain-containing protein [Neorhodopirellula lusitana]|uniref:Ig-like domain-containing protein n=1 Tax=Neorhodopirellula lusitana TaxID=445327 RepID=UPI00384BE0E2